MHPTFVRVYVAAAVTIGLTIPAIAGSAERPSAMRIVVSSGPAAGTYALPANRILCISTAAGLAASFKYFDVPDKNKPGVNLRVRGAKAISEAQIVVDNPSDRGAKHGSLALTFGNKHEHPVKYLVFVPDGGTLAQTDAGSGTTLAFVGHTKNGIAIEATATCGDVEKM